MLGRIRGQQIDLTDIEVLRSWSCALDLPEDSIYVGLSRASDIFRDDLFADCYSSIGRSSVPPSVLIKVIILQFYHNVSDREAEERAKYDLRWKIALGGKIGEAGFDYSLLSRFRSRLLSNEKERTLFEEILRSAIEKRLISGQCAKQIIDSTCIFGAGAVQDTYTLIRKAIIKVLDALKERLDIQGLGLILDYSSKSKPKIDWTSADEREKILNVLYQDSIKITTAARQLDLSQGEKDLVDLLFTVANQDIEKRTNGTVILRKGVAQDRVISVTDPEMRHGRKSNSRLFDGHKFHAAQETEKGFLTNVEVTAGNVHDSEPCPKLIEDQPEDRRPEVAIADGAYGTGSNREAMDTLKVQLISPVPDSPGYKGCFPKSMFDIDLDNETCRCPAGEMAHEKIYDKRTGELEVFVFSETQCGTCPLRDKCTKSKKRRRTVTVNKYERHLQDGRAFQQTDEFKQEYAGRYKIEAKNAELVHHGLRKARYIGLHKVGLQALLIGALVNFKLYWKLLLKENRSKNSAQGPIPNTV